MKKGLYVVLFLVLNFGALGIGTLLMNSGPTSDWYMGLVKAPWTPPGWVFGVAWTSIMLCFSFYMVQLLDARNNRIIWILYSLQWILNVSWNWVFFNKHEMVIAQLILILLTVVVGGLMLKSRDKTKYYVLLILPYFLWLLVANSLNLYTLVNN